MAERKRADLLLVERGLFESRARAQAAIEAGNVIANGKIIAKPSETIPDQYPIDIENQVCVDVGSSTGGFTEVLLANGASLVYAVDVGRGQLHLSLHDQAKIVSMEETDIRSLAGKRLEIRPDVVVIDVSFISLKQILPAVLPLAASPMHLLALIKPQFEAGREHAKKGIVRDADIHRAVCDDIAAFAQSLGCTDIKVFPSSITGGDGNAEFFIGARRG